MISDSGKSVNEVSLTGSIAKGVLLIQKSYEGDVWTTVGNPVVNFYETNKIGAENFYTTAGEDVAQGVYYRIIFAYKTGKKTGTSGILGWEDDVYDYKKHAEVYKFYVALDTATLSLHNLSITEGGFESDEYSVELLKRGETLQDGDTTTAGFYIDKLGSSFYVSASKNNEEKIELADGSEITGCGKDDDCAHTYSEWSIVKSPDCDDSGTKSKTCSKCGDTVTATIPALGHNYVNDECTECGDER